MQMMEMRPEVAIEWLRLMWEFGGRRWIERYGEEFRHEIHPDRAAAMITKSQDAALAIIRLVRLWGDERFLQDLQGEHQEVSFSPAFGRRFDVTKVPLDYIGDLRWYAEATDNSKLLNDIDYLTSTMGRDLRTDLRDA